MLLIIKDAPPYNSTAKDIDKINSDVIPPIDSVLILASLKDEPVYYKVEGVYLHSNPQLDSRVARTFNCATVAVRRI